MSGREHRSGEDDLQPEEVPRDPLRRARDRGAALVEYAMLMALITVVSISAVTYLGHQVRGTMQQVLDGVSDNTTSSSTTPPTSTATTTTTKVCRRRC